MIKFDIGNLLEFHEKQDAIATVCVREYDLQVPYGVVASDGERITGVVEKTDSPISCECRNLCVRAAISWASRSRRKHRYAKVVRATYSEWGKRLICSYFTNIG